MGSGAEEDDEAGWWRPPWEADEEVEPPGRPGPRKLAVEPDFSHPLLTPLARAQDAIARLEARLEAATPVVAEGVRARMAYRETTGWLSHSHVWVHPHDLALRDAGLTGSYGVAARAGHLATELPATAAQTPSGFDMVPSDVAVDVGLRFARLWLRLAEFRTWAPLADAAAMRETLQSLGFAGIPAGDVEDWLAAIGDRQGPALIQAGRAARDWLNRPQVADPLALDGMFLAACLWRQKGYGRPIALPFWTAGEAYHHRLALRIGLDWMAGFLDTVGAAAQIAAGELDRLQRAADKAAGLGGTARSRLPDALEAVLRVPIVTARGLADSLDVSPQAALALLKQLQRAEIIREATGRASWRAFVIA